MTDTQGFVEISSSERERLAEPRIGASRRLGLVRSDSDLSVRLARLPQPQARAGVCRFSRRSRALVPESHGRGPSCADGRVRIPKQDQLTTPVGTIGLESDLRNLGALPAQLSVVYVLCNHRQREQVQRSRAGSRAAPRSRPRRTPTSVRPGRPKAVWPRPRTGRGRAPTLTRPRSCGRDGDPRAPADEC